jgi:5-methylcytosine-specific restriction endonuclease McrA
MNGQVKTQGPSGFVQSARVPTGTKNGKSSHSKTVFICKECGKEFTTKKACKSRIPVYCAWACYMKSVTEYAGMAFTCEYCGNDFKTDKAYRGRTPKYCSLKCFRAHTVGKSITGTMRHIVPWNKGKQLSPAIRLSLSEARKNSPKCKGPNLYNWRGGAATFRERSRVYQNNRRARFINGGTLDETFLDNLWKAHRGVCFYCEQPLTNYRCLEHLTPLSRGGKNQPYNLVYACKSCNSKKRQTPFEDYAIKTGKIYLIDKWEDIFIYAYSRTREEICNTASCLL